MVRARDAQGRAPILQEQTLSRFGANAVWLAKRRLSTRRPATTQELTESLAFALRYDGRKRVYTGHDFMARITAERLVEHLNRSGFVLMKQPPAAAPSLPGSTPPPRD